MDQNETGLQFGRIVPNPIANRVVIPFATNRPGRVTLRVFNIGGEEVLPPVHGWFGAGQHEYTWDASRFDRGVYSIQLEQGGMAESRKLVLR